MQSWCRHPSPLTDSRTVRKQYHLSANIFAKRDVAIQKIPNFWPLVFEQAPQDIDQFIQPQDSRIFAESLVNIYVQRPELENNASGHPRSVSFRFEFRPNDDFEDSALEKCFWYRRARDGFTGLVSEPVKVHWKKGKDPTKGLTDGAVALWEARRRISDMTAKGLPEYTALKKKVEHWNGMNTSFFTWFGWVSGRRWVSAEESKEATAKEAALKEQRKAGQKAVVTDPAEVETEVEDELSDEAVEVHQAGDDLAVSIAEDLWPNAIRYFTQAQEIDEEMSEADFEDDDAEDDDDGDEPVDIRSLVQDRGLNGRSSSGGPPKKRAKT